MSKNLSLDTKTIYQLGLSLVGLVSLAVVILVILNAVRLFDQPKPEPAVKIREQQLKTAIDLVLSPQPAD
jgi:hypothetical protein